MEYKLPDLAYEYNALEPVISAEIMEIHHSKHHQAYVNNLNASLKKYEAAVEAENLEEQISLQAAINFNGGGHINHYIFWTNLAPPEMGGGVAPTGKFADALNETFGSLDSFIAEFNATAGPIQGSGWAWLGYCKKTKSLKIATCANQDPLCKQGLVPLLGIDVWEHAYYLQYKNVRPDYLNAIWQVVNWANVAARYNGAIQG